MAPNVDAYVGVDGAGTQWVCCIVSSGQVQLMQVKKLADVDRAVAAYNHPVIAVDVPLRLPMTWERRADKRVFDARSRLWRARRGKSARKLRSPLLTPSLVTLQAFVKAGKKQGWKANNDPGGTWDESSWSGPIAEQVVDAECWLQSRTAPGRVIEFFPELSFMYITRTVLLSKRTWDGDRERHDALQANRITLSQQRIFCLPGAGCAAGTSDVLDAAAGAWTAARFAAGSARSWAWHPEANQRGSTTAIWA